VAVILHVEHAAISHPQRLVLAVKLVGGRRSPAQRDYNTGRVGRNDLRLGFDDLCAGLEC
jgi:hypothetical protein